MSVIACRFSRRLFALSVKGTSLKYLKLHVETSRQYYLYILLNMQNFLKDRAQPVSVNLGSPWFHFSGSVFSWKLGSSLAYFGEVAPFITGSLFKYVAQ